MSENPYQVHYSESSSIPPDPTSNNGGLYRHGTLLLVHHKATFPDRCIKCNQPTIRRLRRVVYWHLPIVYLLMVASPLIYVIVALFVRKRAEFQVPLSERFISRRHTNMLIAVFLLLAGVVVFGFGAAMIDSSVPSIFILSGSLMLLGPILWLAACLWGIIGCRVISPKYIDDHFAKVSGVGPEFLASLPEWPHAYP